MRGRVGRTGGHGRLVVTGGCRRTRRARDTWGDTRGHRDTRRAGGHRGLRGHRGTGGTGWPRGDTEGLGRSRGLGVKSGCSCSPSTRQQSLGKG